ncbi:MAG: iron ABC transporter permease [Planctomycetes bacterium]|nr:iron ABC transporter permease [Planctomycetota bacterium]
MSNSQRARASVWAVVLTAVLVATLGASLRFGTTIAVPDLATAWRGALAAMHLATPLEGGLQVIVELRLWRALTAAGVGAALGLAGALVQGVFRNGLASPSVLGISGGASLGAIAALLFVGGYGPKLAIAADARVSGLLLIPVCAFLGALVTALVVYRLASAHGRLSIPALLLVGIAINTFFGGVQQLVQMLLVGDWDVSRSILLWTFGTLEDRQAWHAGVAWIGTLCAVAVVPFVAWELDLMQPGLEDAEALGVDTARVKLLTLGAVALAAGAAVAVAGQIAFVGLIVPHIMRFATGRSHKTLLWLSPLAGAVFLAAADFASHALLPGVPLQPGVVMSLLGGPFFVWLLWNKRREIAIW